MKDYKKIINYLEKSEKLLSSQMEDNLDLLHAKINLQFAIMDLKSIDRQQDREIEAMAHQYMEDMFGYNPREALDKLNIRGE